MVPVLHNANSLETLGGVEWELFFFELVMNFFLVLSVAYIFKSYHFFQLSFFFKKKTVTKISIKILTSTFL